MKHHLLFSLLCMQSISLYCAADGTTYSALRARKVDGEGEIETRDHAGGAAGGAILQPIYPAKEIEDIQKRIKDLRSQEKKLYEEEPYNDDAEKCCCALQMTTGLIIAMTSMHIESTPVHKDIPWYATRSLLAAGMGCMAKTLFDYVNLNNQYEEKRSLIYRELRDAKQKNKELESAYSSTLKVNTYKRTHNRSRRFSASDVYTIQKDNDRA